MEKTDFKILTTPRVENKHSNPQTLVKGFKTPDIKSEEKEPSTENIYTSKDKSSKESTDIPQNLFPEDQEEINEDEDEDEEFINISNGDLLSTNFNFLEEFSKKPITAVKYKIVKQFFFVSREDERSKKSLLKINQNNELSTSPEFLKAQQKLSKAKLENDVDLTFDELPDDLSADSLKFGLTFISLNSFKRNKKNFINKTPIFYPSIGRPDKLIICQDQSNQFVHIIVTEKDSFYLTYLKNYLSKSTIHHPIFVLILPKINMGAGYSRKMIQLFALEYFKSTPWIFMIDDSVGNIYTTEKLLDPLNDPDGYIGILLDIQTRTKNYIDDNGGEEDCKLASVGMVKFRGGKKFKDSYKHCYPSSIIYLNNQLTCKNKIYFDESHRVAEDICFAISCYHKGFYTLVDQKFSHQKLNFSSGGSSDDKKAVKEAATLTHVDKPVLSLPSNSIINFKLSTIDNLSFTRKSCLFLDDYPLTLGNSKLTYHTDSSIISREIGNEFHSIVPCHNSNSSFLAYSKDSVKLFTIGKKTIKERDNIFDHKKREREEIVSIHSVDDSSYLVVANSFNSNKWSKIIDLRCRLPILLNDSSYKFPNKSVKSCAKYADSIKINQFLYVIVGGTGSLKLIDLRKKKSNIKIFESINDERFTEPILHLLNLNDQPILICTLKDHELYRAKVFNLITEESLMQTDFNVSFLTRPIPFLNENKISLAAIPSNFNIKDNSVQSRIQYWSTDSTSEIKRCESFDIQLSKDISMKDYKNITFNHYANNLLYFQLNSINKDAPHLGYFASNLSLSIP